MSTPVTVEGGSDSGGAGGASGDQSAAVQSAVDQQLRDLAITMQQMVQKAVAGGFAIRKAIITAVNASSTPPSVQMNISGDTETAVDQVRMVNNFNPQVGQTVLLAKQGSEIFILGAIATSAGNAVGAVDTGWKRATLAAGSHNGNGNGDVYYRRVLDNGSWKMQWRGGWNVSGTTVVSGLDPDFRPTSLRSVLVARDAGGSNVVKVDFGTGGTVTLVGTTTTGAASSSHSHSASLGVSVGVDVSVSGGGGGSGSTGGASAGTAHTHGVSTSDSFSGSGSGSGSGSADGSTDSAGSHSHTVNSPTWVSFNGVEYFL